MCFTGKLICSDQARLHSAHFARFQGLAKPKRFSVKYHRLGKLFYIFQRTFYLLHFASATQVLIVKLMNTSYNHSRTQHAVQ